MVRRLIEIFEKAFSSGDDKVFISKEDPIGTADSEPEPDIAVIKGGAEDFKTTLPGTAELVVEVAISTLKKDQLKAAVYAAAGVKEYWIINGNERKLEKFTHPDRDAGIYRNLETVSKAGFPHPAASGGKDSGW